MGDVKAVSSFPPKPKFPSRRQYTKGGRRQESPTIHIQRLGIRLNSTPIWSPINVHPPSQPVNSHSKSRRIKQKFNLKEVPDLTTYISDVVTPLPVNHDDLNLHRSATSLSFSSTSHLKQVPLPHVSEQRMSKSPRSAKRVPIHGERYVLTPSSQERKLIPSVSPSPVPFIPVAGATKWGHLTQKERILVEQEARKRGRTMKRTSEIMSHRVDRRYYMTGNHFSLSGKYDISQEELELLRKQSEERASSARTRYSDVMQNLDFQPDDKRAQGEEQLPSADHLPPVAAITEGSIIVDQRFIAKKDLEIEKETESYPGNSRMGSGIRQPLNTPVTRVGEDDTIQNTMYNTHAVDSKRIDTDDNVEDDTALYADRIKSGKSVKSVHFADDDDDSNNAINEKNCDVTNVKGNNQIQDGINTVDINKSDRDDIPSENEINNNQTAENELDLSGKSTDETAQKTAGNTSVHDEKSLMEEQNVPSKILDEVFQNDGSGDCTTKIKNDVSENLEESNKLNNIKDSSTVANDRNNVAANQGVKENVEEEKKPTTPVPAFKMDHELYKLNKEDVMNVDFTRSEPETSKKSMPAKSLDELHLDSDAIDFDCIEESLKSLEKDLVDVGHMKDTPAWIFPDDSEEEEEGDGVLKSSEPADQSDNRELFRKKTQILEAHQPEEMEVSDLYMYSFVSEQQKAILTKKFQTIDVNSNGYLSMKELHNKLFENASKRDIALFMKVFDLNHDKTIDLREFVTVAALNDRLTGHVMLSADEPLELNLPKLAYHITAYREMFELIDQDGSGTINLREMMIILTAGLSEDIGTDKEFVEVLLQSIDKDKSGSIDFVEYLSYIPFFLQVHRQLMDKPVIVEDIENARHIVRKALRAKPQYESYYKKTKDIWDK